jgi:hypothetical protein
VGSAKDPRKAAAAIDRAAAPGHQHRPCGARSPRPREVPADVYARSPRVYRGLDELRYPFHDQTITVTLLREDLLQGPEGESQPGLCGPERRRDADRDRAWLVTFMQYDLGYFDDETCRLEPIENPFGPKVVTHDAITTSASRRPA